MNPLLVPKESANIRLAEDPEILQLPLTQRHFSGPTVETMDDHLRLNNQQARIWQLMIDGRWRTVEEIAKATRDPQASVSAQLRNLRKLGHGNHQTPRQRREGSNLWEYRLIPNPEGLRPVPVDPRAFEKGLRKAAQRDGVKGVYR